MYVQGGHSLRFKWSDTFFSLGFLFKKIVVQKLTWNIWLYKFGAGIDVYKLGLSSKQDVDYEDCHVSFYSVSNRVLQNTLKTMA